VLRAGFLTTVAHDLMPPIGRAFAEHDRGITLHSEDLAIAPRVDGVRAGRLDAESAVPRSRTTSSPNQSLMSRSLRNCPRATR
jgi:hypothetical protein